MSPQTPPPTPGSPRDGQRPRSVDRAICLGGGLPRWSFWVLAGVLAAALLLPALLGGSEGEEITYAEFLDAVEAGNVESIEWNNNNGEHQRHVQRAAEAASSAPTVPIEPSDADRALFAEKDVDVKFDTPRGLLAPGPALHAAADRR